MTTDLLSVWTDPDTAMRAVGTSLGIFADPLSGSAETGPDESSLQQALLDVLLDLVDQGELEKRACADGRYAFRWRGDTASTAVATDAVSARLDAHLASMPRQLPLGLAPARAEAPIAVDPAPSPAAPRRRWPRLLATAAPLVLPASSCLLALLAFVALGHAVGLVVVAGLALLGVVGLVRRVPLAGFWTTGLIVAGVLMRLS